MRILLAEDDQHVATIMQLCLEKIGGHQVTIAEDGEIAVRKAAAESFDLILLDGMMPKKSGLQAAREIRSSDPNVPIVFLSAKAEDTEFLKVGNGFIAKPFEPTTICAKIDEIMRQGQGAKNS